MQAVFGGVETMGAKEKYYEHKKIADLNFEGHIDEIDDYVKELESQNKMMLDVLIRYHLEENGEIESEFIIEHITGKSIYDVMSEYE